MKSRNQIGESALHATMHIALFLPTLDGGGAERAFVNLAQGMAELGHRVDLVVANANGPLRGEVSGLVNVVDLRSPRLAQALPALVRYLKDSKPTRIYAALEEAGILAILARRLSRVQVKIVPSIRNTLSDEARNETWKRALILRLARIFYPSAEAVIAVSEGVADDAAVVLKLPRSSIQVIRNPTLTPELRQAASLSVDHPWFNPKSDSVVMGCGRLAVQKDFITLIRAFAVVRKVRRCKLLILGEGPLRDELVREAERLGIVEDVSMPGFDPNPYRFMSKCDVFILSSLFEGSPNVIIQALACGAPVVSTDCPSGPSELLAGVERGTLVPICDVNALAQAISSSLDRFHGSRECLYLSGFDYLESAQNYLDVLEVGAHEIRS